MKNELLEKVKEQYKKKAAISILRERDWEVISERYANELLKLRLGEVREIMPSIACRHLIDKTLKKLDQ